MKQYYHRLTDPEAGPIGPPKDRALISSVQVDDHSTGAIGHDIVHVWNRGGKSGMLVVNAGDGEKIAELLLPPWDRRGGFVTVTGSDPTLADDLRWLHQGAMAWHEQSDRLALGGGDPLPAHTNAMAFRRIATRLLSVAEGGMTL